MTNLKIIRNLTLVCAGVFVAWTLVVAADKEPSQEGASSKAEQSKKDLSHFMRLKLDASSKLLEGLAMEDFALIKEGAKELNAMSTAEKWRVTNDAVYRNFSGEFQQTTKELMDAADKENLDRAALKWMDATMNCIECHRYARSITIATNTP
ncbi:MAG: hypothetical protein KDA52_06580 [Planctomycetaceae bacterium]|nr:hypothetical protein [Planctomycetaceae bacterium]